MQNPYEAPVSTAAITSDIQLEKFSVWLMIGLTIITLSFYMPYWIYTRTKTLNHLAEDNGVNQIFTNFTASLYILTFCFDVAGDALSAKPEVASILKILSFASNVCVLIWSLMFRSALNSYVNAEKGDRLWSNGFLAWFLQFFYHQYKINQILTTRNLEDREQSDKAIAFRKFS